jgi:hypothetical protein
VANNAPQQPEIGRKEEISDLHAESTQGMG